MIDLTALASEEVVGGVVAIFAAIYAVHKKLKSDTVETANQKAEVNIIEALTKQRDDAIKIADTYRERLLLTEMEVRDISKKLDSIENEKIALLEKMDHLEAESALLREIIEYLTDTVDITRKTIDTYNKGS